MSTPSDPYQQPPGYPPPAQPEYAQPEYAPPEYAPQAPRHAQGQPPGYPQPKADTGLASVVVIGCLVAVALGAYGSLHEGTGYAINLSGFSSGLYAKSWLATLSALLALVQLWSAGVMWGRFMSTAPSWIGGLHRWSGRLAVLAATPVAVHCLYAVGFLHSSPRLLIHSVFGCVFFGAFVAKMLSLTKDGLPSRTLPLLGGIVFTGLIALWLTSALWLFTTKGFKL
jgi:hypothetical protein